MSHLFTLNRNIFNYGIVLALAILTVLVSMGGLFLLVVLLPLMALFYLLGMGLSAQARRIGAAWKAQQESNQQPERIEEMIQLADGQELRARVIPLKQMPNGIRMVLTAHGYMLVNEQSRIIHAL